MKPYTGPARCSMQCDIGPYTRPLSQKCAATIRGVVRTFHRRLRSESSSVAAGFYLAEAQRRLSCPRGTCSGNFFCFCSWFRQQASSAGAGCFIRIRLRLAAFAACLGLFSGFWLSSNRLRLAKRQQRLRRQLSGFGDLRLARFGFAGAASWLPQGRPLLLQQQVQLLLLPHLHSHFLQSHRFGIGLPLSGGHRANGAVWQQPRRFGTFGNSVFAGFRCVVSDDLHITCIRRPHSAEPALRSSRSRLRPPRRPRRRRLRFPLRSSRLPRSSERFSSISSILDLQSSISSMSSSSSSSSYSTIGGRDVRGVRGAGPEAVTSHLRAFDFTIGKHFDAGHDSDPRSRRVRCACY